MPFLSGKKLIIFLHLVIWFTLFILPAYLLYADSKYEVSFLVRDYIQTLFYAVIFYLNYLWLVPFFFFRKRKILYFTSAMALIAVFTLSMNMTIHFFVPAGKPGVTSQALQPKMPEIKERGFMPGPPRGERPPGAGVVDESKQPAPSKQWPVYNFMLISFLISGFGLGLRFSEKLILKEKQHKEIEREKLNTELAFLKNQINPHFLFNTLNSIYSLALTKSDMTPEAVMKLSDMMHYVIQDSHAEKVPLEMEVQYIRDYVELQQLRLNHNVDLRLEISGDFGSGQIPPMILIPFVENAFKYGTSSHERATISVGIRAEKDVLDFSVTNQIFPGRKNSETFGIGIRNTKKRLSLIYPGKHALTISNSGKVFNVNLNIHLA
jgi:two-component system, LytTR family, sensor kinase